MAAKSDSPGRVRADELLVARKLAPSRTQAAAYILAGRVRTGPDTVVTKSGQLLPADSPLSIESGPRFVSRGGEKLSGFLERFSLPIAGANILDVGASTGGFTDCLLQQGAASSTCVDVGHGQLHYSLRSDARVISVEKTNARALDQVRLPRDTYDIVVMDLSFISLTKVLPATWMRLKPGGHLIALVKPQFESTKAEADAGRGIIRDEAVRQRAVENIRTFALANLPGATLFAEMESPIPGGDGNREYFLGFTKAAE